MAVFTMLMFIAESGFVHSDEDLLMAKTGILFGSVLAGASRFIWLFHTAKKKWVTKHDTGA